MTEHMSIWNALKTPPATAMKPITGGRLAGKTDINPQWRLQAMTEQFGPIGLGWTYDINKLWLEQGSGNQVVAFAALSLRVKVGDEWSLPIPGVGGSMLVALEKDGLYTSDEAYKMAITDALSVCMKQLGVAADVYAGLVDNAPYESKFSRPSLPQAAIPAAPKQPAPRAQAPAPEKPKPDMDTFHDGMVKLATMLCMDVDDAFSAFVSWAGTRIPGGFTSEWTTEQVEAAVVALREFYAHVRGGQYNG